MTIRDYDDKGDDVEGEDDEEEDNDDDDARIIIG